jgi:demethoxyubiquinone hydroxylase (CLK1/Coq7/Cat5 family)
MTDALPPQGQRAVRRSIPLHVWMLGAFALGLGAGLIVNFTAGPDASWVWP